MAKVVTSVGDSRAQFDEPGSPSLGGRTLYVSDANNHAVRAIDLDRVVLTLRLA